MRGLVRVVLMVLFMFAALAFGAVHVWAYSIVYTAVLGLAVSVFCLCAGVLACWENSRSVLKKWRQSLLQLNNPSTYAAMGFGLFMAAQLVPLPLSALKLVSPYAASLYGEAREMVASAAVDGGDLASRTGYVTIDRGVTSKNLVAFCAYLAVGALTIWSMQKSGDVKRFALVLIVFSTFLCFHGFMRVLTHSTSIWGWQGHAIGAQRVSATFINPDHFGCYLVTAIFLTFGYLLTVLRDLPPAMGGSALRRGLNRITGENSPLPKVLLLVFIIALMFVALLYTLSRGAVIALALAMVLVFFLLFLKSKKPAYLLLLLPVLGFVAYYIRVVGADPLLERIAQTQLQFMNIDNDTRMALYRSGLALWQKFPLVGAGLGAYSVVYPMVKPAGMSVWYFVDYSHNDWLQTLIEGGLLGAIGFVLLVGCVFASCIRGWWRSTQPVGFGFGLGAIGATAAAGIHSFVDFPLRTPANAIFLIVTVCLGIFSLNYAKAIGALRSGFLPRTAVRRLGFAGLLVLAACFLLAMVQSVRYALAERSFPQQMDSTQFRSSPPMNIPAVQQALRYDSLNSRYWLTLSQLYLTLEAISKRRSAPGDPAAAANRSAAERENAVYARRCLARALLLSPADADCWMAWAEYLYEGVAAMDEVPPDRSSYERTRQAFDTAINLDPSNLSNRDRLVNFLCWQAARMIQQGASEEDLREQVLMPLRRAVAPLMVQKPDYSTKLAQTIKRLDLPESILRQVQNEAP